MEVAEIAAQVNHCINRETGVLVHSSSVENGYVVVICDDFTQYVKLKQTPQSNTETAAVFCS